MGLEGDDIGIRVNLAAWQELTDIQRAVYDEAVIFWWLNGYAPSVRDLAERVGRTANAVHRQILKLKDAGLVDLDPATGRTLTITGATWSPPAGVEIGGAAQ